LLKKNPDVLGQNGG